MNRIRKFYDVPPAERARMAENYERTEYDGMANDNEQQGRIVFLAFVLGCACGAIAVEIAVWMTAVLEG